MISKFFIDRPVFAAVISIVIILAGLAAMKSLPIAQYPQILPPQVSVSASYPGASAQVIAETVAAPLEQQINGVEGMIYQLSNSASSGSMSRNSRADRFIGGPSQGHEETDERSWPWSPPPSRRWGAR